MVYSITRSPSLYSVNIPSIELPCSDDLTIPNDHQLSLYRTIICFQKSENNMQNILKNIVEVRIVLK